ncbi:glycosyltransferase family 2 protein [Solimonas marina]|uniref:Glycosyltransferase family 2 protein n=1 Tax=Solimonas marina TaxID=2714601 RepID=A0A969WBV1_9GAMM|nr:glycosyltransferase family 2 protein [Solimonas marina]NKF23669.1 glycosyltransferase family 2 protein [Solimonas marina]
MMPSHAEPGVAVARPPSLSIVVPIYNEADNIAPLVARIHEALATYGGDWELLLVDDGSRDDSAVRIDAESARYGRHVRRLRHARNRGQTAAMQAGIDAARGELIATIDGDLQNDPYDIVRMIDELYARDLDLLCGLRADRKDHWLSRKLPSRIANRVIARVTGVRLHDYGCSLKLMRRDVITGVRLYGEMHRLIPVWVAMVTSPERIGETPVCHHPRLHGRSNYGLSRTFRVMLDLLTAFFFLRFQARPGHFFGAIGLALGALGSIAMLHLAFVKFVLGHDIGGRPLFFIAILLLMFAAQFVTTGILAEIMTRILHQPRLTIDARRPLATDADWMRTHD